MLSSPPTEDDSSDWAAAAAENPILPAAELYFMSRPSERVPWHHLLPERLTWGRKRIRSKVEAAAKAPAAATVRRASPTTPFSWSAGSTSSGDVVKLGFLEEEAAATGAGQSGSGGGDDNGFSVRSANVEAVGFAVWGLAVASSKEVVAAGSRPGRRKMTLVELRSSERFLLEKNIELRKELEKQRLTREHLMEENARLRKLELNLMSREATRSSTENTSASTPEPERRRVLPFDLNESLPDDYD